MTLSSGRRRCTMRFILLLSHSHSLLCASLRTSKCHFLDFFIRMMDNYLGLS